MIDSSMIPDFIIEANEHLDELESSLLKLENTTVEPEVIHDIFRSMHTIKGAAQFVGIERIAELSHKLESLLDLIRQGVKQLDYGIINTLIAGKDRIARLVDELENYQHEESGIDDILELIRIHEASPQDPKQPPGSIAIGKSDTSSSSEKDTHSGEEEIELTEDYSELFTDEPDQPSTSSGTASQDLTPLKNEVANEDQDDELFKIFIDQLQENISLLRSFTDSYKHTSSKPSVIERCSDLISRLYSSANYMGYEGLTEFYGQWIAELEMSDLQLSTGNETSFDFMDTYIRYITEIFPQVKDIGSDTPLPEITEPLPASNSDNIPLASSEDTKENTEELRSLFSDFDDEDSEFDENTQIIAALSDENEEPGDDPDETRATLDHEIENYGIDFPQPEVEKNLNEISSEVSRKHTTRPVRKVTAPVREKIDLSALQQEVAHENFDDDLVQIFMEQLQENISLLHKITADFAQSPEKSNVLGQCTELLTRLHSSSNYMGYERLTEFYGQWIAELEMTELDISTDDPVSLEFMDDHIQIIYQVFPQIKVSGTVPPHPASESNVSETTPWSDDEPETEQTAPEDSEKDEVTSNISEGTVIEHEFDLVKSAFEDEEDAVYVGENIEGEPPLFEEQDDGQTELSPISETAESSDNEDINQDFDPLRKSDQKRETLLKKLSVDLDSLDNISADSVDEHTPAEVPSDEQQLFARLSSALVQKDQSGQHELSKTASDSDESHLFDTLSNALDSNAQDQKTDVLKPIDDVINEILTGSEYAQSSLDHKGTGSAEQIAYELERRQNMNDRRQGFEDRRLAGDGTAAKVKQIIKVEAEKIDYLMNQVSELVVNKSHISQLSQKLHNVQQLYQGSGRLSKKELKPLEESVNKLDEANVSLTRLSSVIQDGIMNVRMVPVSQLFQRFPKLVHDLTLNTDKSVELEILGENTQLDKTVIDEVSDPLIHMIRNAIDHGIEPVGERKKAGKEETATIRLEAYPDSNNIVIEITDDGRGIDPTVIREKALIKDIVPTEELDSMSDEEIVNLVMIPGFSTAEKATRTSGRGVGMDVVKTNIERLNGTVRIHSIPGRETTIRITIPLTLAIIQTLGIKAESKIISIPLTCVEETTRVYKEDIEESEGIRTVRHRDHIIPLFSLADVLNLPMTAPDDTRYAYVVIVQAKGQRVGLIVEKLTGMEDLLIKPMADYLREESGFSGATLKADGSISLILDIPTVLHLIRDKQDTQEQKEAVGQLLQKAAHPE